MSSINNITSLTEDVQNFVNVFRVRTDVFAHAWTSNDGKKKGWSPVCDRRFDTQFCGLTAPKGQRRGCSACPNQQFSPLTYEHVQNHLTVPNCQLGGYPLIPALHIVENGVAVEKENVCHWVAGDFDDHDGNRDPWEDANAVCRVADKYHIPLHIEISKSCTGVHPWMFFTAPVEAALARKAFFSLLQEAGVLDPRDRLSSFDRLFPNQDHLSGKGLGNLIALPWAGEYVAQGGAVFVDPSTWKPYDRTGWLTWMANQISTGGPFVVTRDQVEELVARYVPPAPSSVRSASRQTTTSRTPSSSASQTSQGSCKPVLDGCAFVAYCQEEAESLPEPLWMCMVSNLVRFDDGPTEIHRISALDPARYSPDETDKKIQHLSTSSDPITCAHIQSQGFNGCPDGGCGVKSPAALAWKGKTKQDSEKKVDFAEIARAFLEAYGYGPDQDGLYGLRFYRDRFYAFDSIKYRSISNNDLRSLLYNYIVERNDDGAGPRRTFVEESMAALSRLTHIWSDTDMPAWLGQEHIDARSLLVMENGILDFSTLCDNTAGGWRNHTRKLLTTVALPYSYDPTASCPQWQRFLDEVLPGVEEQRLLQEWIGYNLVVDTRFHKFMLLEGEGANGKSVITSTINELLGKENVSSIPLERLGGRFDLVHTYGKLANVVSEIGELDKASEGLLKAFVAGDELTFEAKFKDVYTAAPTARLTFATNTLPRFADRSGGLWRRMLFLRFGVKIPEERQDRALVDKLRTELPGILNWAVRGLQRLYAQRRFSIPTSMVEEIENYRTELNSARAFLKEQVDEVPGNEIRTDELYSAYAEWCKRHGFHAVNNSNFGKEVRRVFPSMAEPKQKRLGDARFRVYVGIHIFDAVPVRSPIVIAPKFGFSGT